MSVRIGAAALLTMASCGGTRSDTAGAPPDPRLDLAIAVPSETPSLHVPHARIEGTGADRRCIPGAALGAETCATMRVDGDRLMVAFALDDRAWEREVSTAETTVMIWRADEDTPATAPRSEADIERLFPDAEVIYRVSIRGGFALVIRDPRDDSFHAFARRPLRGGDVFCDTHAPGDHPSRDEAMAALELCLGLRAP